MEKTILETKCNKVDLALLWGLVTVIFVIAFICLHKRTQWLKEVADSYKGVYYWSSENGSYSSYRDYDKWKDKEDAYKRSEIIETVVLIAGTVIVLFGCVTMGKVELTITDKRVYGTALWNKRVNITIDSIDSISKSLDNIAIISPSGKLTFSLLKEKDQAYDEINKFLTKKKKEEKKSTENDNVVVRSAVSEADEIRKYKELLDLGVISEEDFETKKKQILKL